MKTLIRWGALIGALAITLVLRGGFADAQSIGILAPGDVIGVGTTSPSEATDTPITSIIDQGICITSGDVIQRGAQQWQCGTATAVFGNQPANKVFAGPPIGSAAVPTFRALVGADLPAPSASSLGGIESYSAVSHQWINAISVLGVPSSTQPAIGDISGWGANVAAALGNTLNAASGLVGYSGQLGSPTGTTLALGGCTIGSNVLCGTGAANLVGNLTLGTQQTTRGALVLANTAAGAFPVTLESSNSSTAAATYVLPPALAGSGPVILTDALGNGVLSWASPSAAASVGVGSTGVTGAGAVSGDCLYNNGGTLGNQPCGSSPPQGRLTLASGTPVMGATSCSSSPCSGQGEIYYDCYAGCAAPVYNGSIINNLPISGGEISDTLPTSGTGVVNASDVFDEWLINVSGTLTLCHATNGSGAGWSGDTGGSVTARGTGYTQLTRATVGYPVNANSISDCYNDTTNEGSISAKEGTYVGTFATTTSAGKVSYVLGSSASGGGAAFLGLWNYYGRVDVTPSVVDNGSTYTYTSNTVRQARASTGNEIQFVVGVAEDGIIATYNSSVVTAAASGAFTRAGVGLDSTTTYACQFGFVYDPTSSISGGSMPANCPLQATVGIHTISANESSDNTNANTFDASSVGVLGAHLRM